MKQLWFLILIAIPLACSENTSHLSGDTEEGSGDIRPRGDLEIYSYKGPIIEGIRDLLDKEYPNAEVDGFHATGVSIRDVITLEPANPEEVGWPALPRKMLDYTTASSWDQTIHFGYEGGFFDVVSVAAGTHFAYSVATSKTLLLIKNTPTNTEPMLEDIEEEILDEEGAPILDSEGVPVTAAVGSKPFTADGFDYVALCVYGSSVEDTVRFSGSIKISGTGVTEEGSFKESFNLSQYSSFFRVTDADTIPSLINLCTEVFEQEVKEVVKDDLASIMRSARYDESSLNNTSYAIQAALYGPKVERIKVNGHHWNVEQATIEADNPGEVKVRGRIIHSIRGQIDDIMDYSCDFKDGKRIHYNTKVKQRSLIFNWRDAARKLIDEICHDAAIEFTS